MAKSIATASINRETAVALIDAAIAAARAIGIPAAVAVVDALDAVIDWHREGLVPIGRSLGDDPRCDLVHGDFFAMFDGISGSDTPSWDVILLDIDHSPDRLLNPAHARFFVPSAAAGKLMFDLPAYIVARLEKAGVTASALNLCTYADPERFFSYRRATHKGEADYGRLLSAITLT